MASLLLGKFIVDGVQFDDVPGAFEHVGEYGPRQRFVPTAWLETQRVVEAPKADAPVAYRNPLRQAWRFGWTGRDSWLERPLIEKLHSLYERQKGFYVQFDDLMSRYRARLVPFQGDGRYWYAPDYPIKPFGYVPGTGPADFSGLVYYDDAALVSGFSVNEEYGIVTFDAAKPIDSVVELSYTWRAPVKILQAPTFSPVVAIAKNVYSGSVVLEQVGLLDDEPWEVDAPSYEESFCGPFTDSGLAYGDARFS